MTGPLALSFTRPWDELILLGWKSVENRTWKTDYRGPLVVHAAQSYDMEAAQLATRLGHRTPDGSVIGKLAPVGYRGVVDLVDICSAGWVGADCDCGPWAFPGNHHWKVSAPRRFGVALSGRGRLGLWDPPENVLELVELVTP